LTFKQIALKIIRANAKKYMLQICSNSFAIAVFYTYMTLLTSRKFVRVLNEHGCDDSFIYAPCIVTIVFSILFIIFSYSTFIKARKPEFGNYLVLGMTSRNIKTLIIVESLIMSAISICIGLGTGMILSKLTSLLVKRILDISYVPIEFTLLSYEYTIGFFGAIFIIATAVSLFSIGKYEIVKLIKGTRYSDRNLLGKLWVGFIGVILTELSILHSKVYSKFFTEDQDTFPVFISIIICCIGIYIVISNTAWFSELILMPFQKKRIRGLMFVSDIRYSFGKVKNIVFVVMLLSAATNFFCNICVYLITDFERITTGYNPYHIAYAEFPGINQLTEEKHFQLFLFSFVGVLFFITSCLLLHFALAIDKDIEKAKFKKLYKMGITKKEAGKIISNKLLLLFILPIVLAIFITVKYCSILFNMTGAGDTFFVGTTLIGSIYLLFQIVFFIVYRRFYINSVLKL